MKLLSILLIANIAWGECNLKTDIVKNPDGTRVYSEECHKLMGQWKNDLDARKAEVDSLRKTITLQDLAISSNHQRVELWQNTSFKLEDRLTKIERWDTTENLLYFAGGMILTSLAVYGAGQLNRR